MNKRYIFPVLLTGIIVLCSACGKPDHPPAEQPIEVTELQTEAPTEYSAPILDGAQNLGGDLWYIPNEAVEATTWPVLEEFQGNLLLSQAENSDGYNADMHTTLIDSRTGAVLAETTRKMLDYQMPKALHSTIAFLEDTEQVTITFLNEKLEEISSKTLDGPCPNAYLSPDGKTLYSMAFDSGITAIDVSTGDRKEILTDVTNLDCYTVCGPYVPIAYDERSTAMRMYGSLNLETGSLELAPSQEASTRLMRWENVWLAADYNESSAFRIGTDEHPDDLRLEESGLQLLDHGELLRTAYMNGELTIYGTDGTYLSSAVLPETLILNTAVSPIWSEALDGYFMLASTNDSRNSRLLFWDLSKPKESGEKLPFLSWEEKHHSGGVSADPTLYARADTISQKYGVTVSIGDQCTHVFPDFTYEQVNDDAVVNSGLDCIEQAFACYPDGFLAQLAYGPVREIQVYLADDLTGGEHFGSERSYSGFAHEDGAVYYLVLDAETICEGTVFHEISHIVDRKLSYAASLRENAPYSEQGWMKLQPEGFEFLYDYSNIPALTQAYEGWFVDDYSQSYPTEDRARIMEYAMREDVWSSTFTDAPHLAAKLQYYSACIRDCFDTSGWPEITRWEKPLHLAD